MTYLRKTGIWKTGGAQAVGKAHRQFIRNRTHGAWQPGSLPAQQSSGLSVSGGEPFSLLELLYYAFTEYNITESPEFKAKIGPLDRKLRDLAETDEAADEYMNVVYSLCAAYERQSYVEGIKVGARLMMEMMEPVTE